MNPKLNGSVAWLAYTVLLFLILGVWLEIVPDSLKPIICLVIMSIWARVVLPQPAAKSVLERILVRFRTLWKHYRTVTIIITMLLVIFVWCLARL